jgi:hypothetical protein
MKELESYRISVLIGIMALTIALFISSVDAQLITTGGNVDDNGGGTTQLSTVNLNTGSSTISRTVDLNLGTYTNKVVAFNFPENVSDFFDGFYLDPGTFAYLKPGASGCQKVTNSSGYEIFIPAKHSTEWSSFVTVGTAANTVFQVGACSSTCAVTCSSTAPTGPVGALAVQTCMSAACISTNENVCADGWHQEGSLCVADPVGCDLDNASCLTGSQCCSGLCVDGKCSTTCNTVLFGTGGACSDGPALYTADGTCVNLSSYPSTSDKQCAKGVVSYDPTTYIYYEGCPAGPVVGGYNAFGTTPGTTPFVCDRVFGQHFGKNGACAFRASNMTDYVCDGDDGFYAAPGYGGAEGLRSDCFYGAGSCDSDLSDGTYDVNGFCAKTAAGGDSESSLNCVTSACFTCRPGDSFCPRPYALSLCYMGDQCDTDTTDGSYTNDGHVYVGTCIKDGTKKLNELCVVTESCIAPLTCVFGTCK